jgi:RHS repeat-associated protein
VSHGTGNFLHGPGVDDPLILFGDSTFQVCGAPRAYFITLGTRLLYFYGGGGDRLDCRGTDSWNALGAYAGAADGSFSFHPDRASGGSGISFFRNRFYDDIMARFLQEDPIGLAGGINLYGFAGGDPVNHTDPFGLCPAEMTDDSIPCTKIAQLDPIEVNGQRALGFEIVGEVSRDNCIADASQLLFSIGATAFSGGLLGAVNPLPVSEVFGLMRGEAATARGAMSIIAGVPNAGLTIGALGKPVGSSFQVTGGGLMGRAGQIGVNIFGFTPIGGVIISGVETVHSCGVF